jgi:hypothetical protein
VAVIIAIALHLRLNLVYDKTNQVKTANDNCDVTSTLCSMNMNVVMKRDLSCVYAEADASAAFVNAVKRCVSGELDSAMV